MERVVRKSSLTDNNPDAEREVARLPVEERMKLFEELLRRGKAFYQDDETPKGYPRVYRVIALSKS